MTGFKSNYSCAELAAMKLPGLPVTKKGWIDLVTRESWSKQLRLGRGGGYEYEPSFAVMTLIRELALKKMVAEAGEIEPIKQEIVHVKEEMVNPGYLKDWQREIGQARLAICREVQRREKAVGKEKAIREIIKLAKNRKLPERLQQAADIANAKKVRNVHFLEPVYIVGLATWRLALQNSHRKIKNLDKYRPGRRIFSIYTVNRKSQVLRIALNDYRKKYLPKLRCRPIQHAAVSLKK